MAKSDIQKEVRDLKAQRALIDERIKHLEAYIGTYSDGSAPSARGGVDIRPTIKDIFQKNNNQPMKVKDIVVAVAKELSMDELVVEKKMEYAKRNVLEKTDAYGMYRLQQSILESS